MLTDHAQAQQLFDALFAGDDMVEIRLIPHAGTKLAAKSQFFNSPGEAVYDWDWISEKSEIGYHVYFGVNPRTERSGKASSIKYARCLFADFDDADSIEDVRKRIEGLPPHTAIVSSGNGFHVYWRLVSRENDMDRWTRYQKAIIAHCKSDKSIHDPPRIMRLPGTVNHKNGSPCELVEITEHRIAEDIAQVFPDPPPSKALWDSPEGQQAMLENKCLPLSRAVMAWLNGEEPASEGHRHAMLVRAATEVVANGWPEREGLEMVRRAAERDGKDYEEIEKVFSFVLIKKNKKELSPSLNNLPPTNEPATDTSPEAVEEAKYTETVRPPFSNVLRICDTQQDGKEIDCYQPVDMIATQLTKATGGWPALARGTMFYPTGDDDSPFRIISNPDQLFAFIHERTSPRWVSSKDLMTMGDRSWRSAITKREFFEYLCSRGDDYAAIETMPHEPPLPNTWYAQIRLPEPSGKLDELIARMNGETEADNELIKSMFATPFAGVPAGSRPMFVLRSRHGRATGKTTTCDIAVKLAGLAADASASEPWDQIARKLVDANGMNGRIVRIDNVKGGRLSSAEFESAITSEEINGHRMYKGSARRQNNLTWIMTANTPNLSTDFATRSVVINIGQAKHSDTTFKTWLDAFLAEHRLSIIADLLAFLRGPDHDISPCNYGRFPEWTRRVLSKFERADELAEHVADQRLAVDTERQDAEEWAAHIEDMIRRWRSNADPACCCVAFSTPTLHREFVRKELTDLPPKAFSSELTKLTNNPPLKHLTSERMTSGPHRNKRFWVWRTADTAAEPDIIDTESYPQ